MLGRGTLLCLLLAPCPVFAQTLDDLKRLLAEREAEVQQIRERISSLEQQEVPLAPPPAAAPAAPPADGASSEDPEDVTRALERALVRQGGQLLPPGAVEAEVNFSYSHLNRDSIA